MTTRLNPLALTPQSAGAVNSSTEIDVRHIASLDGLRAVSFLLVFFSHAGLGDLVPGGFGVTVFFFLSGYLITTLMRAEFERNRSVNLRHFWLRRALRILPPFYLVLGASIGATLLFEPPGSLSGAAVAAQALHVSNYWIIYHGYEGLPVDGGTGVYWSLAVEEHFYILFPWLYLALCKLKLSGRQQAAVFLALCALVLLWRCILVFALHAATDRTYMATDTRVDSILFGCALAVWNNPVLDRATSSEKLWKVLYVPLALFSILICLLFRQPWFRETARYTLQGVALAPIFVAAVRFPRWLPFRLLNWKPLTFVGVLSYSLYLIHYGVLYFVRDHFGGLQQSTQGALSLVICAMTAWGIYILVEKPCARLRRRLTD